VAAPAAAAGVGVVDQAAFDHRGQLCTDRMVHDAIAKIGPADQARFRVANAELVVG
jgi:hypothetical protein